MASVSARSVASVAALADEYDDFLVDVWGVLHDGERLYDGVVAALVDLCARGDKRVLFLTNTSRLGASVTESLVAMGIPRDLFFDVVSSGDVTRAALLHDHATTAPCFHYGSRAYVPWLFELGFPIVDAVDDAALIVASGAPRDALNLEAARTLLASAAARDVPLVCTNPDRIVPSPAGEILGPGAVAEAYGAAGGRVFLYGKPHARIYAEAMRRLGKDPTRRIVALGDRMETDVRGAKSAGIASVLVSTSPLTSSDDDAPDMLLERFA